MAHNDFFKNISTKSKIDDIKQFVNKHILFLILAIYAFIVIVKIILSLGFYAPFIHGDEFIYDSLAQNLLDGKLYTKLGEFYPPGYPIFISIAYHFSSDKNIVYHVMLAINALLTTSVIFPSYDILKRYCSKYTSLLGSLAVAALPALTFFSFTLMTEALFIPLFLFSFWFILKSYETNDKKWELLASLTVVYLYITRSNGLAVLMAFCLTFIYYLVVNRKNNRIIDMLKKKSFLVATFIILLLTWIVISSYLIDLNKPLSSPVKSTYNMGSSYSMSYMTDNTYSYLTSIVSILKTIKSIINHLDYLIITTYFLPIVSIFVFLGLYLKKRINFKSPFFISLIYVFISMSMLIISTVIFIQNPVVNNVIAGRYIEPIIPLLVIVGIICIDKSYIKREKTLYYFTAFFIATIFFVLFSMEYDNAIIYGIQGFINNPSLYPFSIFYGAYNNIPLLPATVYIIPSTFLIIYFLMLLIFFYSSLENKQYIRLLLLFIILSSIVFSYTLYSIELVNSNDTRNNSIGTFLSDNTKTDTYYLIDSRSNISFDTDALCFWNKGNIGFIDIESSPIIDTYKNKTVYLISYQDLHYEKVAINGTLKLYKIQ